MNSITDKTGPEDYNPLGIALRALSRDEIEEARTDYIRFDDVGPYPNEDSLRYFRDETLRWLFRELYHQDNPNVESLLTEALRRSGSALRVKQVVNKIRLHNN